MIEEVVDERLLAIIEGRVFLFEKDIRAKLIAQIVMHIGNPILYPDDRDCHFPELFARADTVGMAVDKVAYKVHRKMLDYLVTSGSIRRMEHTELKE